MCYTNTSDNYPAFRESIQRRFDVVVGSGKPLFKTDAEDLFTVFLDELPQEARQHYTCSACRHFFNVFGGLVAIDEDGRTRSAMWAPEGVPEFFRRSVKAVCDRIECAGVINVFLSDESKWGTPVTGEWHHMAVIPPKGMLHKSRMQTPGQAMAEKAEDYRMLQAGVNAYDMGVVEKAVALLQSEALYRSDKCLGVAQWLLEQKKRLAKTKSDRQRENIAWLAVAAAPAGFCHIRSSMIGTLLDDLVSGMAYDAVSRRFADKMNPQNYMRSQAAPTEGNIRQAEQLVESMGIADSLRRRYATFAEIPHYLWKSVNLPTVEKVKAGGIFSGLIPKRKNAENLPGAVMTWEKFQRTVLPVAKGIEARIDNPSRFMAMVQAADPAAENILQWDNTFSWYYHGGVDGEIKRRVEGAGGRYENNEIRCSLIWEGYTDLDLHCQTPNGEHIYFGNKRARSGGWLDVDANGGRATTAHPVENIRWSQNAPWGQYQFYVHNFCERGNGTTPYKVELEVDGAVFNFYGTASSTGYQNDVFVFRYEKGRPLQMQSRTQASTTDWKVPMNAFVKVNGITTSPNRWGEHPVSHAGNHVFFLLEGCRDRSEGKGRGFFNEMLKPELREIRKTLEAYMANAPIEDAETATACGVGYSSDSEWNLTVRVDMGGHSRTILIDRWD